MTDAPSRAHRAQLAGYRAAASVLGRLPEPLALGLGAALGDLAGRVGRIRRAVVDGNLARAFPDRPLRWRRGVAAAAYRHLGREGVTLLRMSRMGPAEVRERTLVEGLDAVERALRDEGGAVLVTGHLGNWEIGGAALAARGIPLDAVAVRQRNPLFDAEIVAARERLGMRVVEKSRATREALRSLRRGRLVALVADQNVRSGGLFVDFFGVPAATARGPALLAWRTGVPLFLGVALRLPGSRARYRVELREIPVRRRAEADAEVHRLTRIHTALLEEFVRAHPEQYFWHHRRWKTRPPREASEPGQEPATGGDVLPSGQET